MMSYMTLTPSLGISGSLVKTKFTKASFADPLFDSWPIWTCAYHDFREVIAKQNSAVNTIIGGAPIVGGRKFLAIDVRNQYLQPTDWTSGHDISDEEGWHKDTERDPDAIHHIYVIGDNRTIFKVDDQEIRLPIGHYATYDSQALHKGVQSSIEEYRLFVRVCETNDPTVMRTSLRDAYPERYLDGIGRVYLTDEEIKEIYPNVW